MFLQKLKKNKKKIIIVASILLFLLLIADVIASNYLLEFATRYSSKASTSIKSTLIVYDSEEQQLLEQKAKKRRVEVDATAKEWTETVPKQEVSITSNDGLKLFGKIFEQETESHLWCIAIHGFNSTSELMESYAMEYYEHGYNVLTPDQRSYGESEGTYTSMGWREKDDMLLWIDKILELDPQAQIVMHGISMGAATVMMASGEELPDNVKVCVEDCGYSSMWDEYADKLDAIYHLPTFPLMNTASLLCYIRMGYTFEDASCVEQLAKNTTPMLFIHGDADDYNPYWMLDVVYEANACNEKQKLVVKGARHAMACYTDPELYWSTVWTFIDEYID